MKLSTTAVFTGVLFLTGLAVQAQSAGTPTSGAKTKGPRPIGSETQTFTGTLYDVTRTSCGGETQGASPGETCPVTPCTEHFGIRLPDGKLYKFDEGANPKVAAALRSSKKSSKQVFQYWQSGKSAQPVSAQVTGAVTSDVLNMETIRID